MSTLSEEEQGILALEKRDWSLPGAKERAIRSSLGLGATQYYMRLNALLDDPRAVQAEPMLVRRLRSQRSGGRSGATEQAGS